MPLAGLRRRTSEKESRPSTSGSPSIKSAQGFHSQHHHPPPGNAFLAPDSAAAKLRPSSSNGVSHRENASQLQKPNRRFSLIGSRYASDPQMSATFAEHGDLSQPQTGAKKVAPAPSIGLTAPPNEDKHSGRSGKRKFIPFRNQLSFRTRSHTSSAAPSDQENEGAPSHSSYASSADYQRARSFQDHRGPQDQYLSPQLPSSASARSSGDLVKPPPSPSQKNSASSAFFKLSRRKKQPDSLFPLPTHIKFQKDAPSGRSVDSPTPNTDLGPGLLHPADLPARVSLQQDSHGDQFVPVSASSHGVNTPPSRFEPRFPAPPFNRNSSSNSVPSTRSASATTGSYGNARARSATMNSSRSHRDVNTPLTQDSGRNSTTSTNLGRNSMVGLRSLTSKLRHPAEPYTPNRASPGSGTPGTPNDSFALSRETLVIPDRLEGESSQKYYTRLEADIPKKRIAMILSKSSDPFSHDVLRSLMRTFKFYEEPIDMSLRRFLWEIQLPGEAQQIDRVMSAFAERYHECNPHIFNNFDDVYFTAFSLVVLHSDLFNPNNKRKMQRDQYQKNTTDAGLPPEVLGYLYDNIAYTEFIAQDADEEEASDKRSKASARKARRVKNRLVANEAVKQGKFDPYDLVVDDKLKLDILKPALKDELNLEDTYSSMAADLNIRNLRLAFSRFGILQLVSARSRPDAFKSPDTIERPSESHAGIVNMKVAKVGVLYRKEAKKKKGRSPWQEWGAVLTQSQLLFFRNASWAKGLAQQAESHHKHGGRNAPVIFKPPLESLDYDAKVNTSDSVALLDSSYKRHKHAFLLARRGNFNEESSYSNYFEETLLADSDLEMKDWMAKLNYASAFSTSNMRMQSWHGSVQKVESSTAMPANPRMSVSISNQGPIAHQGGSTYETQFRVQLAAQRIASINEQISQKNATHEGHLRVARHLQILAPFVPKTRSELLVYGARMAHNIRWTRFDLHRLRCQKEILNKDLQTDGISSLEAESSTEKAQLPERPATIAVPAAAAPQISSDVPEMPTIPNGVTTVSNVQRQVASPPEAESADGDEILKGIDAAFATPRETLQRFASTDGSLKLSPKTLESEPGTSRTNPWSSTHSLRPLPQGPVRRASQRSDTDTRAAEPSVAGGTDADESRPSSSSASEKSMSQSEGPRPGTSQSSEKGHFGASARSPDSTRTQVRRSLQRTLRESATGSVYGRSKKGKDSASTMADDDSNSLHGGEGLSRGSGTFSIHGKKASVITLGSEWQQMSAEERLRIRKQAQHDEPKLAPAKEEEGMSIKLGDELGESSKDARRSDPPGSEYHTPVIGADVDRLSAFGMDPNLTPTNNKHGSLITSQPGRSLPGRWSSGLGDESPQYEYFTDAPSSAVTDTEHEGDDDDDEEEEGGADEQ